MKEIAIELMVGNPVTWQRWNKPRKTIGNNQESQVLWLGKMAKLLFIYIYIYIYIFWTYYTSIKHKKVLCD